MAEKQQIGVQTSVRDPVKRRAFWRLVIQERQGRPRLAAMPLEPNALLPDMALEINKLLAQNDANFLVRALLRPQAGIVTLGIPSRRRFEDLSRRGDISAFNTDAYEAIFDVETYEQTLSGALRHPGRSSVALDVMEHYSSQLASETQKMSSVLEEPGAARVTSSEYEATKALKISHEVRVDLLVAASVLSMLLLAVVAICGVGFTAKRWMLNAQAGFAAAEVAIAYASFTVNVYRVAMR